MKDIDIQIKYMNSVDKTVEEILEEIKASQELN